MKIYLHESSKLREFYYNADYYSTAELANLPKDAIKIIPVATYCKDSAAHIDYIKNTSEHVVLENCIEGSSTLIRHLDNDGLLQLALDKKFSVICSGEMPEQMNSLNIEYMMWLTGNANQGNKHLMIRQYERPYTFLFLNNRQRQHRSRLIRDLHGQGLLDTALWSNVNMDDASAPLGNKLPQEYDPQCGKDLIDWDIWGCGPAIVNQYTDTYFSVFAESAVLHRYAFITEKTWKPIIVGHPFLALASANHYKRLKELGFKTFDSIIREDFAGMNRWMDSGTWIVAEIKRLLSLDLDQFIQDCQPILDYNIEHFWQLWGNYGTDTSDQIDLFLSQLDEQV